MSLQYPIRVLLAYLRLGSGLLNLLAICLISKLYLEKSVIPW